MMARLPDWETRFAAFLAQARVETTEGRQDYCALFAAGNVEALTGDDLAGRFRGHYREVADNLELVISGLFAEITPSLAGRGDLAWYEGSVGVVIGGDALFIAAEGDFERVPRHKWERAWQV